MQLKLKRIFFVSIGILLVTSACSSQASEESIKTVGTQSTYEDLTDQISKPGIEINVYMNKNEYSLPINEMEFTLENTGETVTGYSNALYVEKYENGNWYRLPYDSYSFTDEERGIGPHSKITETVPLGRLDYPLAQGKYRVVKEFIYESDVYPLAAEFEIK